MEEGEHRAALPRAKRYDEQAPRSFPFSSLPRIGEEEKKPARSAYLFHVFPVPCPSPNIFPILLRLVILSPSLLAAKLKEPKQKRLARMAKAGAAHVVCKRRSSSASASLTSGIKSSAHSSATSLRFLQC